MNWDLTRLIKYELYYGVYTMVLDGFNKNILPGQSLLIYAPDLDFKISQFPVIKNEKGLLWINNDPDKHKNWEIGTRFLVKGPIGKGFSTDPLTPNILMLFVDETIGALIPLLDFFIKKKRNIAVISSHDRIDFPSEVEMLHADDMIEAYNWADQIFCESSVENVQQLTNMVKTKNARKKTEVYIHTPVLCSGNSDCLVCCVGTKTGYVKTCKEGNVFDLSQLEVD